MAPRKSSKPKVNLGPPGRKPGGRNTGSRGSSTSQGAGKSTSRGAKPGPKGVVRRNGSGESDPTRGKARTSAPRAGARRGVEPRRNAPVAKGLGGEQIEGRQAVRELLIGQKRKVREIWIASDIDAAPILDDIEELAHAQRVAILEVPRRKIEETARSEAPQGIIAFAAQLEEASFAEMLKTRNGVPPFLVAVDGGQSTVPCTSLQRLQKHLPAPLSMCP